MSLLDFLSRKAEPEISVESWAVRRLREIRIELAKVDAEREDVEAKLSVEFFGGRGDPRAAAIFSNVESVRIDGDVARLRFLDLQRNMLAAKRAKLADEYGNLLVGGSNV